MNSPVMEFPSSSVIELSEAHQPTGGLLSVDDVRLEPQECSVDVLLEKYAKGEEKSIDEIRRRVAKALASNEAEDVQAYFEGEFFRAQNELGFVPAGRINSAAGTGIDATLINCFVQPVGDSIVEFDKKTGKVGIYPALAEAAETLRRGGGVGYGFSSIRPQNAYVHGTHSNASGPVSYMPVFDASCQTVESAGARRGAQMGVLRCDHPDIFQFVSAKSGGKLTNFNISVGVTDALVEAVIANEQFQLVHIAKPNDALIAAGAFQRDDGVWVYESISAVDLWNQIMRNTYDFAEPGIIFLDRINYENNLFFLEEIESTNPCGEQPLPSYGCCCLGSINLTKHVRKAFMGISYFDFDTFKESVKIGVRMLDNVLDLTFWPLEKQKTEAMNKRRIGLGFLGLGSALVMMGLPYNSPEGREMARRISEVMRDAAYRTSIDLGIEKGVFPLYDDRWLESGFAKRLPEDIREDIRGVGLRNSHLISIAPTGTITLAFADNASNGIEPAFSWTYNRKKRLAEGGHRYYEVADHAYRLYREIGGDVENLPPSFVTALSMSANDHMLMMAAVQPYVDSAISKTVNVPADYDYEDFKDLYLQAWKSGLKGLATYRPNSVLGSVLSVDAPAAPVQEPVASNDVDPLKIAFDSRPTGALSSVTSKMDYTTYEGKRVAYVSVSFVDVKGVIDGKEVTIERPLEVFIPACDKHDGQQWQESTMRGLSLACREGTVAKYLAEMREVTWDKGSVRSGWIVKDDGSKKPRFHDSETAAIAYGIQEILFQRGFLDADFNPVPARAMASRLAACNVVSAESSTAQIEAELLPITNVPHTHDHDGPVLTGKGKKCPECGAHEVVKRDGCSQCQACGWLGSCG